MANLYTALKLGTYSSCNDSKNFEISKTFQMSGKPPAKLELIAKQEKIKKYESHILTNGRSSESKDTFEVPLFSG